MKVEEFKKLIDTDKDVMNKALKCENIGEFKEFSNKENVEYNTDAELNQAWSYVQGAKTGEDGELNEDALDSVAGGKKDSYTIQGDYNKNS